MAYHSRHQAVALVPSKMPECNSVIEDLGIRTGAIGANIHQQKLVLGFHQSQTYDRMEVLVVVM